MSCWRTRLPERAGDLVDDRLIAGRRPVLEALRAGTGIERVLISDGVRAAPIIAEVRTAARSAAVPVRTVPRAEIERLAGTLNHQGVVAVAGRFSYSDLHPLLERPGRGLLFLDGVSDPHNLGSLMRSADGAGFGGIVIPTRRAAQVTAAVRRVSAGASERVPVARVPSLVSAVERAQRAGLWPVGLDEDGEEDLWTTPLLDPPVAIVLGAEGRGVSRGIRGVVDARVRIPLRGKISSLNVAVAGAISMFEVARREVSATLLPRDSDDDDSGEDGRSRS